MLAAGIALFLFQAISQIRRAGRVDLNPWGAGTLEWLPLDDYGARSIPHVTSREPLWDNPELREEVERGEHYLPRSATGERETIVTSAVEAEPQYVMLMPGPSWSHVIAAVGTAGFFLLLTVKLVVPAISFGVDGHRGDHSLAVGDRPRLCIPSSRYWSRHSAAGLRDRSASPIPGGR